MNGLARSLVFAWLAIGGVAVAGIRSEANAESDRGAVRVVAERTAEGPLQGWVARAQDNVCGLRDPRQLSNPALVDFRQLMEETEEMRRLRRDRIDPNSPQGVQLRDAARSKVAAACEAVMAEQGHCSIWTAIRHSDGRQIADVTVLVRNRM
jgi:hypothetical protein